MVIALSGVLTERFGPRPAIVSGLLGVASGLVLLDRLTGRFRLRRDLARLRPAGRRHRLVLTTRVPRPSAGNAPWSTTPGWPAACGNTSVQLGAVLGTTILGSVLSSKVGATLADSLTRQRRTRSRHRRAFGCSVSWSPGGRGNVDSRRPAPLADAITRGSHEGVHGRPASGHGVQRRSPRRSVRAGTVRASHPDATRR